jgi:HK97 gp10 family phage protein
MATDAEGFRLDRAALSKLLTGAEGPVAKDLVRRAIQVEATAKRLVPVDTGRLRDSITHAVSADGLGLKADIGSNVEYAIFVELGTSRVPARSFLRQALVDRSEVGSILEFGT